jgi:hypothetical protein
VILADLPEPPDLRPGVRRVQDVAEVETLRLPVIDGGARLEHVYAANHVLELAEAELRHDLAQVLRDEAHEVHGMFGFAGELLAQPRILRRHTRGAGVEMADAHHDAADRYQRRRGEAELFGP